MNIPPFDERLAQILERVTDAFLALDNDWRIVYVNRHAASIFRRRAEELIGRHIWAEFPEAVAHPISSAYRRAAYATRHGLPNACRLLLNSNEFMFVD